MKDVINFCCLNERDILTALKMKKVNLYVIAVYLFGSFVLSSCKTEVRNDFELIGNISETLDGEEIFLFDTHKGRDVQKSIIKAGQFRFYGELEGIRKFYIHDATFRSFKTLWLGNDCLEMDVTNHDFQNAKVSGSQSQKEGEIWERSLKKIIVQLDSLRSIDNNNNSELDSSDLKIKEKIKNKEQELTQMKFNFISLNSEFRIASYLLFSERDIFGIEKTKALYNSFKHSSKTNYCVEKLDLYLNRSIRLSIGDTVPEINLPNIHGKMISTKSLLGNYFLLEFWETGCKSCSEENKVLRDAFGRFKDKGFQIYGVNLGHEKSNWQEVLTRDTVNWITVSDLQGLNGDISLKYSIEYLPTNYLINPDGVIITKDIYKEELISTLNGIYQ